jgi:hypothetical protein
MTDDRADKVLELVVFKLRDGTKHEDFLATVGPVSDWAVRQPGFISRDLSYDAEGDRWIDLIWWRTLEDAHAAAKVALTSASCAPMFALIDDESMQMVHGELAVPPVHAAAATS